jgi:chromosome segregation ATPase
MDDKDKKSSVDFQPVDSQEKLNNIISERLERQQKQFDSKIKDFENLQSELKTLQNEKSEFDGQLEKLNNELKEKKSLVEKFELKEQKFNILRDVGLSSNYINNITGNNPDELTNSAKQLKELIKSNSGISLPKNDPEKKPVSSKGKWEKFAGEISAEN